jgi:hypothetical protein
MKTLKQEEIYARDYRDLEHLLESVFSFRIYRRHRIKAAGSNVTVLRLVFCDVALFKDKKLNVFVFFHT